MLLFSGKRLATTWTLLTIGLSGLVIYNSAIYFVAGPTPAFLLEKGDIARMPIWRAAFYFHVVGACICLASGAPLMFPGLLRVRGLHRALGYVYINSVLFIAGPSGLVMAPFAKGGPLSWIGFALTGILWWWTTFAGYRAITVSDFSAHTRAMVRSYCLALSAIAFRIFQTGLFCTGMDDQTNYVISLWLSLAASLWLSETCIQRHLRPATRLPVAALKGTV